MGIESVYEQLSSYAKEKTPISGAADSFAHLAKWARKKVEYFLVLTLDGAQKPIRVHEITKGLVNRTLVHPREVFRPAIRDNAVSIVLAHNHPSNKLAPSAEDHEITKRLTKAGQIIGISVLDHLILGAYRYYSFSESGLMTTGVEL